MNASWVSAIAAIAVMIGTALGLIWRAGRRDGKVDEILRELADLVKDHEARLRTIERRNWRGRG